MVRVAVGCKLGGVAERLGAVGAWVGAGRCVGPEVGCQLGAVAKGLWAVWAGVWAGATVREAVGCQLGGVGEGLGAVGARVGAGAAVGQPVRGQLGRVREGLVTVGAAVWALGRGPPSGSGRRRRGRGRPRSSRSHSIFSIRILHLQGEGDIIPKISELSFCDLAGSERCKDQKSGDRLKEAGNINTSLHTLGRCIAALRQNQQNRSKQNLVPFRDSKLTRVFQGFFTGRGRSCMIVNVNPCASTYDETLHVAKFSAIASQLVHAPPVQLGFPLLHSFIKEHSLRASPNLEMVAKTDPGLDDIENEVDISIYGKEELLQVVEAMKALLCKERQEKLQLEMQLRDEICNEMVEQMQQREQWCSEHLDTQKELLEEMYEEKLTILKESLTSFYQEELQERDEKIEELEALLQEARQQPIVHQQSGSELSLRRSQRLAASASSQQLQELTAKLEQCRAELNSTTEELQKYQKMLEPPPSAKPFTIDVDKKLEEGQKNIRLLRTELQKLGESLQSAERACCHSTGAGKLRQALTTCDDILIKQDQTLAELQNNMMLVKLDLRKKAACIAEQYHTVLKLQGQASTKKRLGTNQENQQPNQQPPGKKPFLRNLLPRTPTCQSSTDCSPYARILRSRRSPLLKSGPFGKKY